MERKPAKSGGARRPPRKPPHAEGEPAPRPGPSPVLIATFLLFVILGGGAAWLATRDTGTALPSVSLPLDQSAGGKVEELMSAPKPATAQQAPVSAPPPPVQRRILPSSIGPDGRISLAPVPDPSLVEQTVVGPLPRIAEDGARSWHVYAHPAPLGDGRPKISIVISGMGLAEAPTRLALQRLPAAISLAFSPYGEGLQEWVAQARMRGHEVLLELPMEPYDYPENDPGPQALLTSLSAEENTGRLEWLLSRVAGYAGVTNFFGGKFLTAETALGPVMAELKGRGLMIVDNQSASRSKIPDIARRIGMPFVSASTQLDKDLSAAGIDEALAALERRALAEGQAAAAGNTLPLTIERIGLWAEKLHERGITLAPVTALVQENMAGDTK